MALYAALGPGNPETWLDHGSMYFDIILHNAVQKIEVSLAMMITHGTGDMEQ